MADNVRGCRLQADALRTLPYPARVLGLGRTAIRALQAKADADVVRHFAIEPDGSFWLDTMLMTAEG